MLIILWTVIIFEEFKDMIKTTRMYNDFPYKIVKAIYFLLCLGNATEEHWRCSVHYFHMFCGRPNWVSERGKESDPALTNYGLIPGIALHGVCALCRCVDGNPSGLNLSNPTADTGGPLLHKALHDTQLPHQHHGLYTRAGTCCHVQV